MNLRLFRLTSVLLLATTVTADAQGTRPTLPPYKIGATFPLTGQLAISSSEYVAGAEIAVAEINAAGGVKGHPLQLVAEDTQATPQGGVAAMRKLVDVDGVQVILSIFTSVVVAQMALADEVKIPLLCTIETPNVFAHSQYAFSHAPHYDLIAPYLQAYWKSKGVKRVFAFLGNNSQGLLYSPLVKATALAVGADYAEALINLSDTDFRGVVTRAKDFNPDAVFFDASGSLAETMAIRQTRELGITAQFYEDDNFYGTKIWREGVGPYAEGMIVGGLQFDQNQASARAFTAAYRAQTGDPPGYAAGEYYDLVKMVAHAIAVSGYNGPGIRDTIAGLKDFPSVLGGSGVTMGPNHYTSNKAEALWQIRQGQLVRLDVRPKP